MLSFTELKNLRIKKKLVGVIAKIMDTKKGRIIGNVKSVGHESNIVSYLITAQDKKNKLNKNLKDDGERVALIFSNNCGNIPLKIDAENKNAISMLSYSVCSQFTDWRINKKSKAKIVSKHHLLSIKRSSLEGMTKKQQLDFIKSESVNLIKFLYGKNKARKLLRELEANEKGRDYRKFCIKKLQYFCVVHEEKNGHLHCHILVNNYSEGKALNNRNEKTEHQKFCKDLCKRQGFKELNYKTGYKKRYDMKLRLDKIKKQKELDRVLNVKKLEAVVESASKHKNIKDFIKEVHHADFENEVKVVPIVSYNAKNKVSKVSFDIISQNERVSSIPDFHFKDVEKFKENIKVSSLDKKAIENYFKKTDLYKKNTSESIENKQATTLKSVVSKNINERYRLDKDGNYLYKKALSGRFRNQIILENTKTGYICKVNTDSNLKAMAHAYFLRMEENKVPLDKRLALVKSESQHTFDVKWLESQKLGVHAICRFKKYKPSPKIVAEKDNYFSNKSKNKVNYIISKFEGVEYKEELGFLKNSYRDRLRAFELMLQNNIAYIDFCNHSFEGEEVLEILENYNNEASLILKAILVDKDGTTIYNHQFIKESNKTTIYSEKNNDISFKDVKFEKKENSVNVVVNGVDNKVKSTLKDDVRYKNLKIKKLQLKKKGKKDEFIS